jgi:conjugative coupling factor TraD (TOL family)
MVGENHVLATKLRPPVELCTAAVCAVSCAICACSPWALALTPTVGYAGAAAFGVFGLIRLKEGLSVVKYQKSLRKLSRFAVKSSQIPVSRKYLWEGKGFLWGRIHTQRLIDAQDPQVARYVEPGLVYRAARSFERALDGTFLEPLGSLTSWDSPLNPVRPLPDVGGSPLLHGVEPDETDVFLPLSARVGHTIVFGTTRVGKTRLCEIYVTQDIRRGDVVIVFDPKGDADLLRRVYAEARRAGREKEFYVFHLGYPELSARYNAIGRFSRLTEVSSRVANQLSGAGNSAAFKEFGWRFTNIVARALVALGQRPEFTLISRYVSNIDALMIEYAKSLFAKKYPNAWEQVVAVSNTLNDKNIPINMKGRAKLVVALVQYLSQAKIYDDVLEGLISAVRYERSYFDKIVASLLPLLEKLTSGKVAELLSPNYLDPNDPRPIFDWMQVIRKRGIVYVGLDALSDPTVAAAVGNSMFADLTSVAGHIYKFGVDDGIPGADGRKIPISIHADEFNELSGDEFIPMVNKGGGANYRVTAYTQTLSDIEAKLGNRAKAKQVMGNFNTLQMLRVRDDDTAKLLTDQLHKVQILQRTLVSGATDSSDPHAPTDFTSSNQDRISIAQVPMIEPAYVEELPKGQMFSLQEGGQLWKVRMPLPQPDSGEKMPKNIEELTKLMRESYSASSGRWWDEATTFVTPIEKLKAANNPAANGNIPYENDEPREDENNESGNEVTDFDSDIDLDSQESEEADGGNDETTDDEDDC